MTRPKVAGIILAAGASNRMGRTKQLLPFRGQTILEGVVDNALAAALHRLIVVLGHEAETLAARLTGRNLTIVQNPHYAQGQSTSLKAGLQALSEESDAALFLLGDQPLITPATIDLLLAAYAATPSPIVLPVFEGKRGNPVLFDRETFAAIATITEDCGARSLFDRYAGRLFKIPVDDPSIHFDIDTEDDYHRLLQNG
ncbi:MAG: molybdenum cofactor cytidylyltransferase [Trichloromonadaceae bacterium]